MLVPTVHFPRFIDQLLHTMKKAPQYLAAHQNRDASEVLFSDIDFGVAGYFERRPKCSTASNRSPGSNTSKCYYSSANRTRRHIQKSHCDMRIYPRQLRYVVSFEASFEIENQYLTHGTASPVTCPQDYNCITTQRALNLFGCCNNIECKDNWGVCRPYGQTDCMGNALPDAVCSSIFGPILQWYFYQKPPSRSSYTYLSNAVQQMRLSVSVMRVARHSQTRIYIIHMRVGRLQMTSLCLQRRQTAVLLQLETRILMEAMA